MLLKNGELGRQSKKRWALKNAYLDSHPSLDNKGASLGMNYLVTMFVLAKSDVFSANMKRIRAAFTEMKILCSKYYPGYLYDLDFRYVKGNLSERVLQSAINYLVNNGEVVPSSDMTTFMMPRDVRRSFLTSEHFRDTFVVEDEKSPHSNEIIQVIHRLTVILDERLGISKDGKIAENSSESLDPKIMELSDIS